MAINGLQLNNTGTGYVFRLNPLSSVVRTEGCGEASVFNTSSNIAGSCDTFSKTSCGDDIALLKEEFSKIKETQGLIGKAWNGIKNLFNMKNSSDNVEDIINHVEDGTISYEDAAEQLEKYKEGQKMCVDIFGDIVSGIGAVGAAALAPATGGASLLVAAAAGAGVKTAIKASDAAIGGREYGIADVGYDLITGSINGAMAPLSNAIGGAAGTGVAKALGLEVVESCAKGAIKEAGEAGVKQVGKSFFTRLLAKQGASYVTKQGAKGGAALIAAKALSYGVDMTIDSALSGATDAFARALAEGRIEDMPEDIANGAIGGAIGGIAIGGSTRLVFSGASKLSSRLALNASNEIPESVLHRFSNVEDALEYLQKSDNIRAKDIIKAIEKSDDASALLSKIDVAIDVMEGGKGYSNIEQLSNKLAEAAASNNYTKDTIEELYKALGIDGDIIYNPGKKNYSSTNEFGNLSARSKDSDSILSKIRNKIFNLEADLPQNVSETQGLLGDLQGTRLILNTVDDATSRIRNEAVEKLGNIEEANLFIQYLQKGKNSVPKEKLMVFKQLETDILGKINEEAVDSFVTRMENAIRKGDLRVTELHNYSAENGLPYLSKAQTERISKAYDDWFAAALKDDTGKFTKTVTEGIPCLVDEYGNLYKSSMIVETPGLSKQACKDNGYTAAQFNIITKNGQPEELQFRGSIINDAAESEHIVYDLKKGKETVVSPIYDEMRNVIKKLKDFDLFKEYNEYYSEVFLAARRIELGVQDVVMPDIKEYPNLVKYLNEDELKLADYKGVVGFYKKIKQLKN